MKTFFRSSQQFISAVCLLSWLIPQSAKAIDPPYVEYHLTANGHDSLNGVEDSNEGHAIGGYGDNLVHALSDNTIFWSDNHFDFPSSGTLPIEGTDVHLITAIIGIGESTLESIENSWYGTLGAEGLQPNHYYIIKVSGPVTLKIPYIHKEVSQPLYLNNDLLTEHFKLTQCDSGGFLTSAPPQCYSADNNGDPTLGCETLLHPKLDGGEEYLICGCTENNFGFEPDANTYNGICIEDCDTYGNPCANGGVCTNLGEGLGYDCNCDDAIGYEGLLCDEDTNECNNENGGCDHICTNDIGSFSCSCENGYVLNADISSCDDIDECLDNNGGCAQFCLDIDGSFECSCGDGYSLNTDSSSCDDINECDNENGGCDQLCTNDTGSFSCSCENGYVLNADISSCDDIDECLDNNGGCAQFCLDIDGSFECSCGDGYSLNTDSSSCDDINECDNENGGCDHICTNDPGSFSCSCENGYVLNADISSCDDIDECLDNNGGCAQTCLDIDGSFECSCGDGYSLNTDSSSCDDINECDNGNGGCDHICTNDTGSFSCSCENGYVLNADDSSCGDIDECGNGNNNCHVDAICTNEPGGYDCSCPDGYFGSGQGCANIVECDDPADNNCDPNAYCTDEAPGYFCTCNPGFDGDGETCVDIDECFEETDNCLEMATCVDNEGSFECQCPSGFSGDGTNTCDDVNECDLGTADCGLYTSCENTEGGFECPCLGGYAENDQGACEIDFTDDCPGHPDNPCGVGGSCEDTGVQTYACTCFDGFVLDESGSPCEIDYADDCVDNDACLNGSTCADTGLNAYGCICTGEFSDIHCDVCGAGFYLYNEALDYTNTEQGYAAGTECLDECPLGFSENENHCEDTDECADDTHDCGENTVCVNVIGDWECDCAPGYNIFMGSCVNTNECIFDFANDCDENAVCTDNEGSYTCDCNTGYTGDGYTCEDIDECESNHGDCDTNASCENAPTPGEPPICTCLSGYTGDGISCADIDECADGLDNCNTNAACNNTIGSFECECNDGYNGDGITCIDIDECTTGADNCDENATCEDTGGSFECTCNSGYNGDGTSCTDDDECANETDDCPINATCINESPGWSCECNDGFHELLTFCVDNNECLSGDNNCDVNAACNNIEGSFECECNPGYNGDGISCEDIDECQCCEGAVIGDVNDDDILNVLDFLIIVPHLLTPGGTLTGNYLCTANMNLDEFVNILDIVAGVDSIINTKPITCPCRNGSCENGVDEYICTCEDGFDGTDCENNIDDCPSNACNNAGYCIDGVAGYTCACYPGYGGTNCETNYDECAGEGGSNNCHELATCTDDSEGTFTCECDNGYVGDGIECEIDLNDDCATEPCGMGDCADNGVLDYTCTCHEGYTLNADATNCIEDLYDDCAENPCLNDGDCVDEGVNSYSCTCNNGFSGNNCGSCAEGKYLFNEEQNYTTADGNYIQGTQCLAVCPGGYWANSDTNNECFACDCPLGTDCIDFICHAYLGCVEIFNVDESCNDGEICTLNDQCNDTGQCIGELNSCDDVNSCTLDSCQPGTGCLNIDECHAPETGAEQEASIHYYQAHPLPIYFEDYDINHNGVLNDRDVEIWRLVDKTKWQEPSDYTGSSCSTYCSQTAPEGEVQTCSQSGCEPHNGLFNAGGLYYFEDGPTYDYWRNRSCDYSIPNEPETVCCCSLETPPHNEKADALQAYLQSNNRPIYTPQNQGDPTQPAYYFEDLDANDDGRLDKTDLQVLTQWVTAWHSNNMSDYRYEALTSCADYCVGEGHVDCASPLTKDVHFNGSCANEHGLTQPGGQLYYQEKTFTPRNDKWMNLSCDSDIIGSASFYNYWALKCCCADEPDHLKASYLRQVLGFTWNGQRIEAPPYRHVVPQKANGEDFTFADFDINVDGLIDQNDAIMWAPKNRQGQQDCDPLEPGSCGKTQWENSNISDKLGQGGWTCDRYCVASGYMGCASTEAGSTDHQGACVATHGANATGGLLYYTSYENDWKSRSCDAPFLPLVHDSHHQCCCIEYPRQDVADYIRLIETGEITEPPMEDLASGDAGINFDLDGDEDIDWADYTAWLHQPQGDLGQGPGRSWINDDIDDYFTYQDIQSCEDYCQDKGYTGINNRGEKGCASSGCVDDNNYGFNMTGGMIYYKDGQWKNTSCQGDLVSGATSPRCCCINAPQPDVARQIGMGLSEGCDENPCENGGVCLQGINTFQCQCPEGFHGPLCESENDALSLGQVAEPWANYYFEELDINNDGVLDALDYDIWEAKDKYQWMNLGIYSFRSTASDPTCDNYCTQHFAGENPQCLESGCSPTMDYYNGSSSGGFIYKDSNTTWRHGSCSTDMKTAASNSSTGLICCCGRDDSPYDGILEMISPMIGDDNPTVPPPSTPYPPAGFLAFEDFDLNQDGALNTTDQESAPNNVAVYLEKIINQQVPLPPHGSAPVQRGLLDPALTFHELDYDDDGILSSEDAQRWGFTNEKGVADCDPSTDFCGETQWVSQNINHYEDDPITCTDYCEQMGFMGCADEDPATSGYVGYCTNTHGTDVNGELMRSGQTNYYWANQFNNTSPYWKNTSCNATFTSHNYDIGHRCCCIGAPRPDIANYINRIVAGTAPSPQPLPPANFDSAATDPDAYDINDDEVLDQTDVTLWRQPQAQWEEVALNYYDHVTYTTCEDYCLFLGHTGIDESTGQMGCTESGCSAPEGGGFHYSNSDHSCNTKFSASSGSDRKCCCLDETQVDVAAYVDWFINQ